MSHEEKMAFALAEWEGPGEDPNPLDFAASCPKCGELPYIHRNSKPGYRWIAACESDGCDDMETEPSRTEIGAVESWNEMCVWVQEAQAWEEIESARIAKDIEEAAWFDERDRLNRDAA